MDDRKCAICVIVKNEHRYIKEWIDYNLKIGFDVIHVFEDYGSESHKDLLKEYIDNGTVVLNSLSETKYIPSFKRGTRVQCQLFRKFFNECKEKSLYDWVAFIDVDEFIFFEDGWDLYKLEDEFSDCGGVLLSWRMYGASGHIKRPTCGVIEAYTEHMPDGFILDGSKDWAVKSLVNIKKCNGLKHIHVFYGCEFTDHKKFNDGSLTFGKAWINHYFTKSWEDFLERIFSRGNMQNNFRSLDNFFVLNPSMKPNMDKMIEEQRNRHCTSTMWISRKKKIISGGNLKRLEELRNKYLNGEEN